MTATIAAELRDAVKVYRSGLLGRRELRALDGVSFRVHAGEVVGLVGPNRAGKTTAVKTLLSLSRPSGGQAFRFGLPIADRRTLSRVGYVPERPSFPPYLSAAEVLDYYGTLALVPAGERRRRIPALLERTGLADRAGEPVSRFSKGMVQRLGLAQALINDPELLVLDEPDEGLDVSGRELLHEALAEQRGRGRAAILVSHAIRDVEIACDRVIALAEGRLVRRPEPHPAGGPHRGAAGALEPATPATRTGALP
ncbi:putative ABC transporter ATP-binding protein YxlF [Aquisphaera giovannonii]|uniref:Putative ABC transporter ATP-binding protein YxlF n=1 Tax=Aquisphaera giovannonii TaxID=406548 RepID=A0A5B9W6X7_9BACT|nr:ABC transporter ATP-binding protein [Aquisphaera giovannonii]QEH35994.1 putative ABC transporter ATP-binding protein YxlF [Aquisphaera giovannonii]